jgi:hypothetical protein
VIVQTVWLMGGDRLGGRRETRTETMSRWLTRRLAELSHLMFAAGQNAAGGIAAILMSRSPSRERSGERVRDIPSHSVKRTFQNATALNRGGGPLRAPLALPEPGGRLTCRKHDTGHSGGLAGALDPISSDLAGKRPLSSFSGVAL